MEIRILASLAIVTLIACSVNGFTNPPKKQQGVTHQFGSTPKPQCPREPTRFQSLLILHSGRNCKHDESAEESRPVSRRLRYWRRAKKAVGTFALALSLRTSSVSAVELGREAEFDTSGRANDILLESLRPGSTEEDAELAMSGESVTEDNFYETEMIGLEDKDAANKKKEALFKAGKQKGKNRNLYDDDEDEDDEEDAMYGVEEEEMEEYMKKNSGLKTSSETAYFKSKKGGSAMEYFQAAAFFGTIPIGGLWAIEVWRRKNEGAYIKKGLAIQKMLKKDYINKTKEAMLKNATDTNSTDTDTDDDPDSDGGGGGGGGGPDDKPDGGPNPRDFGGEGGGLDLDDDDDDDGGFGGNNYGGDSGPADRSDIDKLNKLMGKG